MPMVQNVSYWYNWPAGNPQSTLELVASMTMLLALMLKQPQGALIPIAPPSGKAAMSENKALSTSVGLSNVA